MSLYATTMLAQVEAAAAEPNWIIIVTVVAVLLAIIIFLCVPKKQKELEDDKKEKSLTEDKDKKESSHSDVNLENYEEKKENLSLAEIKAAKRQTADDMSKEELRELRKERRAATQTEKALREHEDEKDGAEAEKSDGEEKNSSTPSATDSSTEAKDTASEKKADDNDVKTDDAVAKDEASTEHAETGASDDDKSSEKSDAQNDSDITIDEENVVIKSDVDTKDVFTSLFGNAPASFDDPFANFNDPFSDMSSSGSDDNSPVFQQTLGSKLISLDELSKAAAEADAKSDGSWEELTKRLVEKSEKKNSELSENSSDHLLEDLFGSSGSVERLTPSSAQENDAEIEEKERAEREAKEKERAEREAKEKERAEREAKEKERAEREAKEKERAEREAKEKERAEREAKEKERAEREEKEKERAEREEKERKNTDDARKLAAGLKTTRSEGFIAQIGRLFRGKLKPDVADELEEILMTADIGVSTSDRLLERVTANLRDKGDGEAAMRLLKEDVREILKSCEAPFEVGHENPHVILVVGVNGAGKTTTLGKLAAKLVSEGKKVLLIAGDTFRAAAIEQLEEWQKRCGCEIFRRNQGADPSGTIFDGIKYAQTHGFDIALADTAGRLHNNKDLTEELKKIYKVAGKALDGAPHQVLLVLDATNGQNAIIQAREFGKAIPFTGICLTKLDGTAKGGVIIGICEEFKKPIYYIGIGEMIDDLRRFDADEFLEALFLES